jgi:hypothetical protein
MLHGERRPAFREGVVWVGGSMCARFIAILATGVLWASIAQADPGITVGFDSVKTTLVEDRLQVAYAIQDKSWAVLRAKKIDPQLHLYLRDAAGKAFAFRYAISLSEREGKFLFPKDVATTADDVELRLHGYRGGAYVAKVRVGDEEFVAMRRNIERPPPPEDIRPGVIKVRAHPSGARVYLLRGGGRSVYRAPVDLDVEAGRYTVVLESDGYEPMEREVDVKPAATLVLDLSLRPRANDTTVSSGSSAAPVSTEEACRRMARFDSDQKKCMVQSRGFHAGYAVEAVLACGAVQGGSFEFRRCLDTVQDYSVNPTPIIQSCAETTGGSFEFRKCFETFRGATGDYSPAIRACARATSGNLHFRKCLRKASEIPLDKSAETVASCAEKSKFSKDFFTCVDAAI